MTFLDWLKAWLRDWRFRFCRAHNIIGTECSRCGWPLRMFNVYLPQNHPGLSRSQKRALRRYLSPPLVVVKEVRHGGDSLHWAPVGFDLTIHDHVWLTERLHGLRMVERSK